MKNSEVVVLKSGGPKMTIVEIDEENETALCEWFARNTLKEKEFKIRNLKYPDSEEN